MNYQITEDYSKKEYECKKCGGKTLYAKIAKPDGSLYTTDGQPPNGKFGKESNVLSGAVDALVKDRLHGCSAHFVEEVIAKIESGTKPSSQASIEPRNKIDYFVCPPESDNDVVQMALDTESDILRSYISRADKLTKEIYPNLYDANLIGQIRSKFVDQLLILHQIRRVEN